METAGSYRRFAGGFGGGIAAHGFLGRFYVACNMCPVLVYVNHGSDDRECDDKETEQTGDQMMEASSVARPGPPARAVYARFSTITTRWMDNDVYRHVNNVVYYSFFDTAVNGLLIEAGVLDVAESPAIGLVVETGCRYFSPIAFPDRVAAGVKVAKLGRSSVQYEVGLFRNDAPTASAAGHFVHVYVDRVTNEPAAIPNDVRAFLTGLIRSV
jgi:acyl-CoA thioester hydrolase